LALQASRTGELHTGWEYNTAMDYEFRDGRLFVRRTTEERRPLLQRLNRIEGQVRGVRQMIEEDRHCRDEIQQINAIVAAMREVALLVVTDHLNAAVEFAVENQDGKVAIDEMINVLRAALTSKLEGGASTT
jgi:DNA-binding FrmR family transcriptional regulator